MIESPSYLPSSNDRVPKARVPFRHFVDVQMRFADVDMLGHVNNNAYFTYMDLGKIAYFRAINNGRMQAADVKAVIVHVSNDFFEPTLFEEPLQVWTTITHVGQRSFTLEQRIVNPATGATKCVGTTILAGFDPATQRGADLDPQWIAAAEAYETRKL